MKYKYSLGYGGEIVRAEVVKETAQFITLKRKGFSGEEYERREAKASRYTNWFDSRREVYVHKCAELEHALADLKEDVAEEERQLAIFRERLSKEPAWGCALKSTCSWLLGDRLLWGDGLNG